MNTMEARYPCPVCLGATLEKLRIDLPRSEGSQKNAPGTLVLDHTLDEIWGLVVMGGSAGYCGGQNELGNYRAPVANVYCYAGYFMGPFVPSLGLTLQRFFGVDRDRGIDQEEQLSSLAGTAELEWSTDTIAILAGVSLPYGWEIGGAAAEGAVNRLHPGLQPWTAALGVTLSPF